MMEARELREIEVSKIDVSPWNMRRDLLAGQHDTTILNLIDHVTLHGVFNPPIVRPGSNGRYEVVSGQRRVDACRRSGTAAVEVWVMELSDLDAIALSVAENKLRAETNPMDDAWATGRVMAELKNEKLVAQKLSLPLTTVRQNLALLQLSPSLQRRLAAGEVRGRKNLTALAKRFPGDFLRQETVFDAVKGLHSDSQFYVISMVSDDLEDLQELVEERIEWDNGIKVVKNCLSDCPFLRSLPPALKATITELTGVSEEPRYRKRRSRRHSRDDLQTELLFNAAMDDDGA
jgi:ParB/RepB/Spo0J family partition protein